MLTLQKLIEKKPKFEINYFGEYMELKNII